MDLPISIQPWNIDKVEFHVDFYWISYEGKVLYTKYHLHFNLLVR